MTGREPTPSHATSGVADPTVVYLAGLGRSGSTLLERMVAEAPSAVLLGETIHLWERGLQRNERCACGEAFRSCPLWTRIGQRAFGGWDAVDVDRVLDLRARVDRNRHVPGLLAARPGSRLLHAVARYADVYRRIHRAAADLTGSELVVDSSKHVSLAVCLQRGGHTGLRVVHVVRDSPGVAHSWAKEVQRPEADGEAMTRWRPWRTSFEWMASNALADLAAATRVPTLRVRYERLVADPAGTLADVLGHADVPDAVAVANDIVAPGGVVDLSENHSVAGNPMRFSTGPITVRPDGAWNQGMTSRDLAIVRTLTLPVRWRLGYTRRTPHPAPDQASAQESS